MQLGLFAPQTPEPSRLDVTLARLRALVGDDRVGSPVLKDTHRSGSFAMEHFAIPNQSNLRRDPTSRLSLRRMRPPHPLRVQIHLQSQFHFATVQIAMMCRLLTVHGTQAAAGGPLINGIWTQWDVIALSYLGETIGCQIAYIRIINGYWMPFMIDGQGINICDRTASDHCDEYIELHASSAFSFLGGASEPESFVERAVELENACDGAGR